MGRDGINSAINVSEVFQSRARKEAFAPQGQVGDGQIIIAHPDLRRITSARWAERFLTGAALKSSGDGA